MKRYLIAACAGLSALAMATPSSAAELARPAYKAPVYVGPGFTWSGLYVGINGGYAWGDADITVPAGTFSTDTYDGWMAGVTIGYNLQTGVWVWGLEADIDYAWLDGNTTNVIGGACAGGGGCTVENTFFATARGRIGYAWDRWLPFITGGAAFANAKITAPSGASQSDTNFGWTVGAGLEYAFLGAWSAKIEYLYADLGNGTCDVTVCGVTTDYELKINTVRAGLNYRF